MSNRGYANAKAREKHIPLIKEFCKDHDLKYKFVNGFEWHIRIEDVLDVFPTRNRWHWLETDERGSFEDYDELGRIFIERIEQ
jgi:hypothetical protein